MRSAAANFLPWRLKGIRKTVVTFHDLRVPYLFPKAGPLRQWAIRFMARHAHGVIVTNPEDYHSVLSTQHSALIQIPIGSNITVHKPDAAAIHERRDLRHRGELRHQPQNPRQTDKEGMGERKEGIETAEGHQRAQQYRTHCHGHGRAHDN